MKVAILPVLVITCAGLTAARGKDASITGTVVVTRTLTKARVTLPAYQLRGVPVDLGDRANVKGRGPGEDEISRVVVYLEGRGLSHGAPVQATLTQKDRQFDQEIVVVPVGSTVSFPNEDAIFHNVFSLSGAKQFDLGYYPKGQTRFVKFDRPGLVQVYCHIHANMNAAILVLDTDQWTRPAPDGHFSLQNVSPGDYELVAWHHSAGFFQRHVRVSAGEALAVDFTIPIKRLDSDEALTAETAK